MMGVSRSHNFMMKPIMQFQLKTFSIIVMIVLSGSFKKLECWGTTFSDVTYEEINALNATCGGLDSCELPRDPYSLGHCSCDRFCSLLGTCCIDSRYRDTYPEPLKNVECFYIHFRKMHHNIPMIRSCDPDVETDEATEKLCNSDGRESSDPFLRIPVTDPITGISYKNYYCFACNKNYGGEEPIPWDIELVTKAVRLDDSSMRKLQYDRKRLLFVLKVNNSTSVPSLTYDNTRETWVMDHNQENATDVRLHASLPEKLKNVTPVCYRMVKSIVSECASNWTDDTVKKKCMAYMAVISVPEKDSFPPTYRHYQNPHCALCNYESMDDLSCYVNEYRIFFLLDHKRVYLLRLFSLQDRTTKTCADFMVYDHFSNKCRRLYRSKRGT
nr:uncharacterized protein LOC122272811 [Parasteatoda tepidariorum]